MAEFVHRIIHGKKKKLKNSQEYNIIHILSVMTNSSAGGHSANLTFN